MKKTDFRREAKVLFYDEEVSPSLGYYYGGYDVTPILEVEGPILLSISWKWLGEKKVHSLTLEDCRLVEPHNDKRLVKKLWELLDECQIACGHNCVEENTPILTADLKWLPAKELKVGDKLAGFEEGRPVGMALHGGQWGRRKMKLATVTELTFEEEECWEVSLSNGDKVITTKTHPWLIKGKNYDLSRWCKTQDLQIGYRVPKYFNVWERDNSFESGWLGGFISGEGSVDKSFSAIQICQNRGSTWEKALNYCQKLGLPVTLSGTKPGGLGKGQTEYATITGGRAKIFELFGRLELVRFIDKIDWDNLGMLHCNKQSSEENEPTVVGIAYVGKKRIARMGTSTSTYFAAGYAMHNSKRFDDKMANYFFVKHNMTPPSPYKEVDTLQLARKYFKFNRNNLDYLDKFLGGAGKTETTYADVWKDLLDGDKKARKHASVLMKKYNEGDVLALERIYNKLLPWADNHPNMALMAGESHICPRCGNASDFRVKAYRRTGVQVNAIQYECLHCHGYVTRKLEKYEREELDEQGKLKSTFRNTTA